MYEYRASLLEVHDGDTIRVMLDQGLREYRNMAIRFFGINAPELSTAAGKLSRTYLVSLLGGTSGIPLVVRTIRDAADKYGERWDGKVWLETDGVWDPATNGFVVTASSLNDLMVAGGFAVKYP